MYLNRRNTSVDESYEWDSADACVDSEVLEAMRFDHSQTGFRRGGGEPRYDQAGGLQDRRQKGNIIFFHILIVCVCVCDVFDGACVIVSVMLDLMTPHVFLLCPLCCDYCVLVP